MSGLWGGFRLGVNYWSRGGGPRMWERFDETLVRVELAHLRAVGLDCARAFAFVPTFMPAPPAVDGAALARFRLLLDAAQAAGVGLLPTALVGHMSGENFDFPGRAGRSLWSDPTLLAWQRALVGALAEAGRGHPAVVAWVLSNEMPLWGGPSGGDEIAAWCRALTDEIRRHDPRPIGTGDGMMGGFPSSALAPLVDYVAPHIYYGDLDPMRQALATDYALRAAQALGRPVVLEEFGCATAQAGEAEQAAYWRESIHAAFGIGAAGALGWCWSDYDVAAMGGETPYSHHGFELGFGVVRADGSEKPVCDELRAARGWLDRLGAAPLVRPRARAALIVPSYLEDEVPFSWQDRTLGARTLLQAYVLAVQAGLDPDVVGEDGALERYDLLLCPATQKLRTPTWQRLRAAADGGATVYWSFFYGDYHFHQGMWCPLFTPLTGLDHHLRYGCFDLPPPQLVLRGDVTLDISTGLGRVDGHQLAMIPVEPRPDAPVAVLARDGHGGVALTAHQVGRGRVIFLACPLERYLALAPDGSRQDAHRLYRLLGEQAGLEARYPTHHPDVMSRVLEQGADDVVIVQHRGWGVVDDATEVPRQAELLGERGARGGALGPKGTRVYRVPGVRSV